MQFRGLLKFGASLLLAAVLGGCSSVPPEQLARLATVEAGAGHTLHTVDSEIKLFADSVNVEPGVHTFQMTVYCANNQCSYRTYRFRAEAGYLYRLMPNRSVLVLDRNDRYQRKLDELTQIGEIDYGTRQQVRQLAEEEARRQEAARQYVLERRRQNLPQVRKVGARICRVQNEFLHIGFVEDMTEEKVRIRVAEARINVDQNLVVTNFQPVTIWDSPLNWDLCE